jgi:hypothetical protein
VLNGWKCRGTLAPRKTDRKESKTNISLEKSNTMNMAITDYFSRALFNPMHLAL